MGAQSGVSLDIFHQTNASLISMGRSRRRHEQDARPAARCLGSDSSSNLVLSSLDRRRVGMYGGGMRYGPRTTSRDPPGKDPELSDRKCTLSPEEIKGTGAIINRDK